MRHVVTHLTFQIGQLRRISLAVRFLLVWKQYCRIHGSLPYSTYAIKRYSHPLPPAWPPKDYCELWCLYRKQGTLWGILLSWLFRCCNISSSSSCDIGSHHTFMNNFGFIHLKRLKSLHLPLRKRSVLNISLIWFCSPLSSSDNWGLLWIRWNIQETFQEARGSRRAHSYTGEELTTPRHCASLPFSETQHRIAAHASSITDFLKIYLANSKRFISTLCASTLILYQFVPGGRRTIFLFWKLVC